jgi:hypothetical protein
LCKKSTAYFKRLISDQTHQNKQWTKSTTISDSAQEASYALLKVLQEIKSRTIAESVIFTSML